MKTLLGTIALLLALTSCGSDDGGGDTKTNDTKTNDTNSPPAASTSCDDIWIAGETLPEDYDGCDRGDTIEAPAVLDCTDGSKMTGFDDRFYAKLGGEIHEASGEIANDKAYSAFLDECASFAPSDS